MKKPTLRFKPLMICAAFMAAISLVPVASPSMASSVVMTSEPIGGKGGEPFAFVVPNEIAIRQGKYVDALILNDKRYGGRGGEKSHTITLGEGDYWKKVEIWYGKYVDGIRFTSKSGRTVGKPGTGKYHVIDNIRLISIRGAAGKFLDRIELKTLTDYKPPRVVQKNVQVIYSIDRGPVELLKSSNVNVRRLDALKHIASTTTSVRQTETSKVETQAELSKGIARASVGMTHTRQNERFHEDRTHDEKVQEAEKIVTNLSQIKVSVLETEYGFRTGRADIMRSGDGGYWLRPTSDTSYIKYRGHEIESIDGFLDASGGAKAALGGRHKKRNGFYFITGIKPRKQM